MKNHLIKRTRLLSFSSNWVGGLDNNTIYYEDTSSPYDFLDIITISCSNYSERNWTWGIQTTLKKKDGSTQKNTFFGNKSNRECTIKTEENVYITSVK